MDSVETGIPRHENMDRAVTPSPTIMDGNDIIPCQRGKI